jgi:hypothetical protein
MSRGDLGNLAWFAVVIVALLLLFAGGAQLPVARAGWRRLARGGLVVAAAALVLLANIALYRHDVHFDVTRSHAFTPSPEAQRVIRNLTTDVELT